MPSSRPVVPLGADCFRHDPGIHHRACSATIGKLAAPGANRFSLSTLLQIVPRVPGGIDGVGDYALTIAQKLRDQIGCDTLFATFKPSFPENAAGFEVLPLDSLLDDIHQKYDHVLLHYVNYGFQKRGIPFRLLSILRALRKRRHGKLITIFHELYDSGPPWTSAFWLQPLQIHLAKSVGRLSDACIASNDSFRREVQRLVPNAHVELHPVPSGLGEPALSFNQIAGRDPHWWTIIGGTALTERSLRWFRQILSLIPEAIAPRKLVVLGGEDNPVTRSLLADLAVESDYHPCVAALDASEILKTCSFALFDYFRDLDVETSMILKSSAFASACAHGVIPILPYCKSKVSVAEVAQPGPFFIDQKNCELPAAADRATVAFQIYEWYQRYAHSNQLVGGITRLMELSPEP